MHWTSIKDLRQKLRGLLEELHPGMVKALDVSLLGDMVLLSGRVDGEPCRSDAKRLALSFDGVFKVRNDLAVVGYLVAASDDPIANYFDAPAPRNKRGGSGMRRVASRADAHARPKPKPKPRTDARRSRPSAGRPSREQGVSTDFVDVSRNPLLLTAGELKPGANVEVTVDLVSFPTIAEPMTIGRFPQDWKTIEVSVHLVVPWATEIVARSPMVKIHADGNSEAARFSIRVGPDVDATSAQVQAVFMHGTRICGHLLVDLAKQGPANAGGSEPSATNADAIAPDAVADRERGKVRIVPDAAGPTLAVTIIPTARDMQTWTWQAIIPGGRSSGADTIDLDGGAKAFSDNLLLACPGLDPVRVGRMMNGIGEQLWRASPTGFRDAYARCREVIGLDFPIQFITDDPYVPWEMMKPDILGARHLFMDHPVARWPLNRSTLLRASFGKGDLLSFVPKYPPGSSLPSAELESRWIADELGAVTMPPRTDDFFNVIEGRHPGPVRVIHFAGHGRADSGNGEGGIEMEDEFVGVLEFDQSSTVLGEKNATLIVLNACELSASARMLGMNTGWGAAIAARNFGGLVAPLWEVEDAMALDMMKVALPDLLSGKYTLGEALRNARLAHHATSASPFAYLAHGDVMARFPD